MQLSFVALLVAFAATANAIPTGPVFMRASCNIASCVAALAPTVVSCVAAAASEGANVIADAACLASAANAAINFPPACDQCAEEFDIAGKADAAGQTVVHVAEEGAEAVGHAAEDVGDKVGDLLGSIF